jgi:thymidylate kinase
VRAKYFEAFEKLKDNENIIIIDGNRNSEVIASEILSIINSM